ncbi:MAG: hypothetical protein GC189_02115 [Alphaproteobacteria bacterium]|nr:hypothetical protein [Alphaproteobacteria bacterium]
MKTTFPLLCVLALCACASRPESAAAPASAPDVVTTARPSIPTPAGWEGLRAAGIAFRGLGQEPAWILDVYADEIRLSYDYGNREAVFPRTPPALGAAVADRVYASEAGGHSLRVVIGDEPCQDVMSGELYPRSVQVTIDGRQMQGCGAGVAP